LHLIDDDLPDRAGGGELFSKPFRILQIAAILLRLEKVDPKSPRVGLVEQGGLSGLPGTPEEESLGPRRRQANRTPDQDLTSS
jgi:hypothetical protein